MNEKILHQQPIIAVPTDDKRVAFGVPGQDGANNIFWRYLKRESRNAGDVNTDTLVPLPSGRGFKYIATAPLKHIASQFTWTNPDTSAPETEVLQDGETVYVVLEGTGKEILHNQPASGVGLPIWNQSGANYTTKGIREVFIYRLFTFGSSRIWLDCTAQSKNSDHIADTSIHFEQGDILHSNIQEIGNTSHADLDLFVLSKSQPLGLAALGADGKVLPEQLPLSIMNFRGTWNAATNTPALADGIGDAGDVYTVSVAGTHDFGSGAISFEVGDWVLYSGTVWEKRDNTDAVTSVFGRVGAVVATAGDYEASKIANDSVVTGVFVSDALNSINTKLFWEAFTGGISYSENVVIGNTVSSSKLEVVGDIYSRGLNWTLRTSATDNEWRSVVYGNGLFVAVSYSGIGNRVMTSPDGVNWTIRASAADNEWRSVVYGNGLFVAVSSSGAGHRVMTSGKIETTNLSDYSKPRLNDAIYLANVGVGVTNPRSKLDVSERIINEPIQTTTTGSGTYTLDFENHFEYNRTITGNSTIACSNGIAGLTQYITVQGAFSLAFDAQIEVLNAATYNQTKGAYIGIRCIGTDSYVAIINDLP